MTRKSMLLIILASLMAQPTYASTQAHLTQLVQQAPTVTSLHSSVDSGLAATNLMLAVHVVSANGLIVPDGTVVLSDGVNAVDTVSIINGVATITEAFSSLGVHHLVACYSGDGNYLASCSSPMNLVALAPYTLQQSNPSVVIEGSNPFVDKLSVIPAKGFIGVVQLACQVPADQCALSPSSLSFSGDGKTQVVQTSFVSSPSLPALSFVGVPLIGLIGFRIGRRYNHPHVLATLVAVTMLLGLAGCGPFVTIPFNSTNVTMRVNATSGVYSQAVMYQIQVETDVAKQ